MSCRRYDFLNSVVDEPYYKPHTGNKVTTAQACDCLARSQPLQSITIVEPNDDVTRHAMIPLLIAEQVG